MAARKATTRKRQTDWKNRIVDYGEMTAEELEANPNNPRIHDRPQKDAMEAMLGDVGWVQPIVVNRLSGLIVDGHMRVQVSAQRGPVPVAFVELDEEEEARVLALMDPIGAMATHDPDALNSLIDGMTLADGLDSVLADLLPAGSSDDEEPPPDKIALKPLSKGYALVSVPLDLWDQVAPMLESISLIDGVDVDTTVA